MLLANRKVHSSIEKNGVKCFEIVIIEVHYLRIYFKTFVLSVTMKSELEVVQT